MNPRNITRSTGVTWVCAAEEREGGRGIAGSCVGCPGGSSGQYSAAVADHFSWPCGLIFLAGAMGHMPEAPPLTCNCTRLSHQSN